MKFRTICIAVAGLSAISTLIVFPSLPQQMPAHWNAAGEVDWYAPKWVSLILGFIPLLLFGLFYLSGKTKWGQENLEKNRKTASIIIGTTALFLTVIHWVAILYGTGYQIDMPLVIKLGVGLLFVTVGNYLPKVKPNMMLGLRLPWTLKSEAVWYRTHRVAGWVFTLMGLAFVGLAFVNHELTAYVLLPVLFLSLSGTIFYSWRISKKQH